MTALFVILTVLYVLYYFIGPVVMADKKGLSYKDAAAKLTLRSWVLGAILLLLFIVSACIVKVGPQEVGVVITPLGVEDEEITTGWHLLPPWYRVEFMDKTVWVYTFSNKKTEGQEIEADAIWSPSNAGMKMGLDVSVNWSIEPAWASWILSNVSEQDGDDEGRYDWIERNVIRPKTISALSLTTKDYSPTEIFSYKRDEIQDRFAVALAKELEEYHLKLNNVDIREVFYNRDYEKIIDAVQINQQEVLNQKEITKQKEEKKIQAEIDKDIAIKKAEGESKALQIKGEAVSNNPKIVALEYIAKWNGQLPKIFVGGGSGGIGTLLQIPNF